ncbi:MAG: YidC/Oxa1 family membrane protein insertase [Longicatena sp.]
MKKFFKNKKKFLAVIMLMVVTLTGCSVPRGENGKTYVNSIISVKDETVKRGEIDIAKDDTATQNKYKDYKASDLIEIKATSFGDAMDEGWFTGLIVWPIAQLINWVATFTDAGIGIIAATFLIQVLIFLFSLKSQVANQRLQTIQPEINKITAKYAGKTDDRSKMAQAQETQALYSKYKINPFGTILVTIVQFPVILGMYQATMRAYAVVTGSFQGINLALTPLEGFKLGNYWYIVIFVLMVLFQLLSFKMPQWLEAHRKKKNHVKVKKYAEPAKQPSGMMGSMNMMMYMSTAMIAIFAINWPLGMSFYWLVNSIARVIQNVIIHKFFIKD